MNNPYMFPDQCIWEDDFHELQEIRKMRIIQNGEERYDIEEVEEGSDGLIFILF